MSALRQGLCSPERDFHLNPEGNSVTARALLEVVRPVLDGLLVQQALAALNGP